jgi:pyruvate ferredoxin oxidoreductase gamma subunit
METIRIHGRGGQGVVTAAELIAIAAFYDGKYSQAFPSFGVERSGAPIQSFARIDDQPIITREQIYRPDILIIQDSTLIDSAALDIFQGATRQTKIIINAAANRWPSLSAKFPNLYFSPATEIAVKILGRNLVNTVILGALVKYTGLISLESLQRAIGEKFAEKGQEIINKNLAAVEALDKI